MSAPTLRPGDLVEAEVESVAHGGHCVARVDGQVVFVRHALPGERVVVRVTELDKRFARGDAVEVLVASPDRVEAPCPLARPDGCGGCDFQHASLPAQRDLKSFVVTEQLHRLGGIERTVEVEAVPGDQDGLRWRTRMQYVALPGGRRGLRKHRSHDVVPVEDCLIAREDAREISVVEERAKRPSRHHTTITETVHGKSFRVAADGFWQVHPGAPTVLVDTVLEMLAPRAGERVLDLYAGVGLFSAFLAEAVGPTGEVTAVESDRVAAEHGAENLTAYGWTSVVRGRVDTVLARWTTATADLVVLDPPRVGAKRDVVDAIAALAPRAVAYVACDPAALARDLAIFAERGYGLAALRAFDLFPMTSHTECVALLAPVDVCARLR